MQQNRKVAMECSLHKTTVLSYVVLYDTDTGRSYSKYVTYMKYVRLILYISKYVSYGLSHCLPISGSPCPKFRSHDTKLTPFTYSNSLLAYSTNVPCRNINHAEDTPLRLATCDEFVFLTSPQPSTLAVLSGPWWAVNCDASRTVNFS
jgi:hypothetical protein